MCGKYARHFVAVVVVLTLALCLPVLGVAETMEYLTGSEFNPGENPEIHFLRAP